MTFVITDPCVGTMDQSCVAVCPVDCIHFDEGTDSMLYIDPVECIDCGACQPACPVSAIFPEADVPAGMAQFTEINALWYQDKAAARALVGPEGDAAPAAPAAAPTIAAAQPAVGAVAVDAPHTGAEAEAQPAATVAPPSSAGQRSVAERAAVAVAVGPAVAQVTAAQPQSASPVMRPRSSPVGVVLISLLAFCFVLMFTVPGPPVLAFGAGCSAFDRTTNPEGCTLIGLTVALLAPAAVVLALAFIVVQGRELSMFSSAHERRLGGWRRRRVDLRRNEESRRYMLNETVQAIARDRFAFPNAENPDLRTYVNLPQPTMAIEPRGTGEKLFPDILTVAYPGNYPVAIAHVETRETLTREQAANVWKRLENEDVPLYLYVPAGMLPRAKDYAKWAGLKKVRFRTWRWSPNGMIVREL